MIRPDDEMLMAYADGELDAAARDEVEAAIAADPALRARVEAHRELRRQVLGAYAGAAEEPVPDRLVAMLQPAPVIDLAAARTRRTPRVWPAWSNWAAIAATLVVGVLAGRMTEPSPPIAARGGALVAQGELARTLDTELASVSGAVGLSFRNRDGDYCRTFRSGGVAGLACRDADGWGVRMATTAGPAVAGDYRMAGSETPTEVLRAVEATIAGAPLDAAAEAAARARGWRD